MMENHPVNNRLSADRQFDVLNFLQCDGKKGARLLESVSEVVSTHKHEILALKKPAGATFRVGGLEDTIYKDANAKVNGWSKFYLPRTVGMQVIGVVEGTSSPCDLVLMICEDKKLYAYDGEELHLVGSSWEQLNEIEYPASERYYNGESFKDMTEEDWANVKKGPEEEKLDQQHYEWVTAKKSSFLENLKMASQKRDAGRTALCPQTRLQTCVH